MSLYSDYINANFDPEDYEEPENRCQCGAFISKTPTIEKRTVGIVTVETLSTDCKRCGRNHGCDQFAFTIWGGVDLDDLRDHNGDWITDPAEIERIVKARNPHKWTKEVVGSGAELQSGDSFRLLEGCDGH